MYIQEISIAIKTAIHTADIVEVFDTLLAFYRSSGQKLGKLDSQYLMQNTITSQVYTHERDSLAYKYNNKYVNGQIEQLEALCGSTIKIKLLGSYSEDCDDVCTCAASAFYVLTTDYVQIASPLTCGGCNKYVPLYKIPPYNDFGYMQVLHWETNYSACDNLQMNGEVGEKWALNQLQKMDAQLSRQGIAICRRIETLTNIPTCYFLFNYRKSNKKTDHLCPGCRENWMLKEKLHGLYRYKCDDCRLISTDSLRS